MKAPRSEGCPDGFTAIAFPCGGEDWVVHGPDACPVLFPSGYCEPGKHPNYSKAALRVGSLDIAERIRKSGYDVIVIQEMWWNEAEEILRDELKDVYPFYVQQLSESGVGEGSGLNIFSKLPFVPIATSYGSTDPLADLTNHDYLVGLNGVETECRFVFLADPHQQQPAACTDFVAFQEFEAATGGELWANKGVGHVRVQNPDTNRIHNVFFTHLQATYSDEHDPDNGAWHGFAERTSQMAQVREFILHGQAGGNDLIVFEEQDVFLLGDLNIDGDHSNPRDSNGPPYDDNLWEWSERFRKGAASLHWGYFAGQLHDTWQYEHPIRDTFGVHASDFGQSASLGSGIPTRLDYILSNTEASIDPLCNQHPQLARNMLSGHPLFPGDGANPPGGRNQLADGSSGVFSQTFHSDHLGVNAHYNKRAPHCSPLLPNSASAVYGSSDHGARVLLAPEVGNQPNGLNDPNASGQLIANTLEHPGSVQWYYLEWDGSYLIGFDENSRSLGYRVQVYRGDNLSLPIKAYGAQEHSQLVEGPPPQTGGPPPLVPMIGQKWVLEGGPFYLKVYHPEHQHRDLPGNASGTYALGVERLGCTDKNADACPLLPNTDNKFEMPSGAIGSSPTLNSMYFELAVERLTVPGVQNVRFDVFNYSLDLLESAIVEPDPTTDIVSTMGPQTLQQLGITGTGVTGTGCSGTGTAGLPGCNLSVQAEVPSPSGPAQRLVWRVRRPGAPTGHVFNVAWSTDLTVVFGGGISPSLSNSQLYCKQETSDGSPHDEIDVMVTVDGATMLDTSMVERLHVGSFDTGQSITMDDVLGRLGWPWRYRNGFSITLVEDDPVEDEFHTLNMSPLPANPPGWGPASNEGPSELDFIWAGGHYRQKVIFSHGLQAYSAP